MHCFGFAAKQLVDHAVANRKMLGQLIDDQQRLRRSAAFFVWRLIGSVGGQAADQGGIENIGQHQ